MSVGDMDAFRAELLRQKIIFDAELRRQRETFDERLSRMSQDLADREADCRNLQAVVTILGKKVDALMGRRAAAGTRRASPLRAGAAANGDASAARDAAASTPLLRVPSPAGARNASPFRRIALASSLSSAVTATTGLPASVHRAPSHHSFGSRQNSPSRTSTANGRRPRLGKGSTPDRLTRRSSAQRLQRGKTADDWQ